MASRWLSKPGFKPAVAVGFLVFLTMGTFVRQLFAGWTFPWDFLGTYTTTPPFVAATIGGGHAVLWSPFVASGFPVAVDVQAELYYPIWWLFGALGIPLTLGLQTAVQVAHVLVGGVGVLMLARARRLSWTWALVAAAAYLFFGGFYGETEHADIFRGFAYLPWLLWALTPPDRDARWTRLVVLPPLVWLIVSGAYPGELVSFAMIGAVYVIVGLYLGDRSARRRNVLALLLASGGAGAVCLAVDLPYLLAVHGHQLYRAVPPTAAGRAGEAISPLDLLGLYLNNFAWTYDGTVTAWGVGVPVLIGIACLRLESIRRHAPLVAAGVASLALAMTPKIGPIGRIMIKLGFLFPDRFPAADYKAGVAVALVVLAAESWSQIARRRDRRPWVAALAGAVLAVGAILAPATYGPVTRTPWLLAIILACTVSLAVLAPKPRVLAALLLALVVVNGLQEARSYRLLGSISSWMVTPTEAAPSRALNTYIRTLPAALSVPPASRPARVPPAAPLSTSPTGTNNDASGWIADGYHMIDYGGTIELALRQAEQSRVWTSMLLAPWHAYVFPCAVVGCVSGSVHLPPTSTWRPSAAVHTVSYGAHGITYDVSVDTPVLMVENELAISGWRADTPKAQVIDAGIPLRGWRLAPGDYQFTATYHQAGEGLQDVAVAVALLLWLGCGLVLRRRPTAQPTLPIVADEVSAPYDPSGVSAG